ncbi:MAG: mevalonate kinase [Aigarchaeota archaeon]|nr:mevalonate kinase [Aigarchaeota archaeon]MDW8092478.1 mevalonate kinase [Nitrososphaerota archaeon]
MEQVTYSSPAKIILFGEHFVVYGAKAISSAINLRSFVRATRTYRPTISIRSRNLGLSAEWTHEGLVHESPRNSSRRLAPLHEVIKAIVRDRRLGLSVEVWSDIPRGSGLGSSASVSVALAAATLGTLGADVKVSDVIDYAMIAERMIHSRPSGVDVNVVAHGGIVRYVRGGGIDRLEDVSLPSLLLVHSGLPRKTGVMVERVARFKEQKPSKFAELMVMYEGLIEEAERALVAGDSKRVGELMVENHHLLREIGVSNPTLDSMVKLALESGALGAKLTGGGGGGFVISLVNEEVRDSVMRSLAKKYRVLETSVSKDGLRREPDQSRHDRTSRALREG